MAIVTGIALLLAVAGAGWWVFSFPFDEDHLHRALPPNAEAVSVHRGLPDRWTDFLQNPLTDAWLAATGLEPGQPALRVDTNGVATVMAMLRGGPAMVAWTPALGAFNRPALVGAAWAGGHSQLMRWGWLDQVFSDFTVQRRPDGRRIWVQPQPWLGLSYTLSLAIHEGLLLAVLSDDAHAIDAAVARAVRGSREQTPLLPLPEMSGADDAALWAVPPGRLPFFRGRVQAELTGLGEQLATVALRAEGPGLLPFAAPSPDRVAALPGLLGDMPSLLAVGSLPLLLATAAAGGEADLIALAGALGRHADPDAPFFLAASGQAMGGTVLRLRVPALWVGAAVEDADQAGRIVQSLLDTANARVGMGLVAEPVGTAHNLHVLTPVGSSFYRRLSRGERAAFAVKDGWLVISSSLDALQRLLAVDGAGRDAPAWDGVWNDGAFGVWADGTALAALGRQALAGHALIQLLSGAGGERLDTPQAQALLNGLAALRYLRARGTLGHGTWQLEVSAGAEAR